MCFTDQDSVRLLAVQCCGSLSSDSQQNRMSEHSCANCAAILSGAGSKVPCTHMRMICPLPNAVLWMSYMGFGAMCRTSHGEFGTMWPSSCTFSVLLWDLKAPGKLYKVLPENPVARLAIGEQLRERAAVKGSWQCKRRHSCMCICRSDVLPPFLKLLRDSEAEVRVAAASKVSSISNLLDLDAVDFPLS